MESQATRTISAVLDPVPSSVAKARREVDRLLATAHRSPDGARDRLWLVVSELLSNAIVHGSNDPIRLELNLDRESIRVCVHHHGAEINTRNLRRKQHEGGRGLAIVTALSQHWTIDSSPAGTTVTAKVPLEPL